MLNKNYSDMCLINSLFNMCYDSMYSFADIIAASVTNNPKCENEMLDSSNIFSVLYLQILQTRKEVTEYKIKLCELNLTLYTCSRGGETYLFQ